MTAATLDRPAAEHWVHRAPRLRDLRSLIGEIASNPGTDADVEDMCEELADLDARDEEEIAVRHLEAVVDELEAAFADGAATLHRAISVDDVEAFVASIGTTPIGCHWTTDPARATTSLHGGEHRWHDVVVTGEVEADAVSWAATMQARMAHPCEREVFVTGRVRVRSVVDAATGRTIDMHGIDCES